MYCWHGSARKAVGAALDDDAWRVREMALRVVVKRGLGEHHARVVAMCDDPSARVRAAATKALHRLAI